MRSPTISFCTWDTLAEVDEEADIANVIPDLAVEMFYPANTPKEMNRKRKEYFAAGTTIVWQVYPKTKTVEVYTSPGRFRTLGINDTLDGGSVMPGFRLPVRTLFSPPTKPGSRRKKYDALSCPTPPSLPRPPARLHLRLELPAFPWHKTP